MKQRIRYNNGAMCIPAVLLLNTGLGLFSPANVFATVADELTAADIQTSEGTPVFSEITLQESYKKGASLSIPRVTMTLGENQYIATAILHRPDGSARSVSGAETLDMAGEYTLEYTAAANGRTFSAEKKFSVYQPKFELSDGTGVAEYRQNMTLRGQGAGASGTALTETMSGEYISLEEGQTLTIHDYFDITRRRHASRSLRRRSFRPSSERRISARLRFALFPRATRANTWRSSETTLITTTALTSWQAQIHRRRPAMSRCRGRSMSGTPGARRTAVLSVQRPTTI